MASHSLNLALLGAFAAVALALAVVGLYGVLVHAVVQRRREIGIRMALGAETCNVLGLLLGQGMRLALIGVFIGLASALALARVLRGLLFEVEPTDALTYTTITILLLAVSALASWLPARRAARIDPMEALRYE